MSVALLPAWMACSDGRIDTGRAEPPPLADPARVRLIALGDAGKGNEVQARVARSVGRTCEELGCDLILLLGDNLYPSGMTSADDPRAEERIALPYVSTAPVYALLGNHDWDDRDAQRAAWQVAWAAGRDGVNLPAPAWSMEAGPVTFAAVDTNTVFQVGRSFQQRWLTDTLDGATTPWTVVLGHHTWLSDGPHGNAGSYEGVSWAPIVSGRGLRKLFDQTLCGRADLYLSGHDHLRELLEACGTEIVVSGAGASATELVDRGNQPRFARATPGFAWLELGTTEGEVRFYDEVGTLEAVFPLRP